MAKLKSNNIWIAKDLIQSPAFHKLNGTAKTVLLLFFCRRQWSKIGRKGKWVNSNNGEIIFPYLEAEKTHRIPRATFARAIDNLILHGFLDISHLGGGMYGDCTKYKISDRWEEYGTDDFTERTRPKDKRRLGFTTDNWEKRTGKMRRQESQSTIKSDNAPSNKTDTGMAKVVPLTSVKSGPIQNGLNFFISKGEQVLEAFSCPQ